jgi:hypothetical protein
LVRHRSRKAWRRRAGKIAELERAGKYAETIPLAQAMLANREKGLPSRDLAGALNNLAQLYGDVGRNADAEPLQKRALAIMEKAVGLDSLEMAPELGNLAALYVRQRRYADSEPLFKRALLVREGALGQSHSDVGQSSNNLATLYERQDRHADSEPLFKRALAIYEKAAGPEHPAVATVLNNLGRVLKSEGCTADAEPLIKCSLALREKLLGRDHPDVAWLLNNLADLYQREQRFCRRRAAVQARVVDPQTSCRFRSSRHTMALVNNPASLYQEQGRLSDALPLAERMIGLGRAQARAALPVLLDAGRRQLMPQKKVWTMPSMWFSTAPNRRRRPL